MEEILRILLHEIATARDLLSVNVAAGVAHDKLVAMMAATTSNTDPKEVPEAA